MLWLVWELLKLLRYRLLAVGALGLAAVGCRLLAAGVLYAFVDAMSKGQESVAVSWLEISVSLERFFVGGVIVGAMLMALSTVMLIAIRRAAATAASIFEVYCVRRALVAASQLPDPTMRVDGDLLTRRSILLVIGAARGCNFIARQVVQLTPSLISLAAALVVLLAIDSVLTLTIAAAFFSLIVLQYPMTNRSVRASSASEGNRRAAMLEINAFMERLPSSSAKIEPGHSALARLLGRGSAFQIDLRTFTRRIDGALLSDMVTRIGNHAILAGLFIFIGLQILSGERDWAAFAVYVAIARMAMKDFQTCGKIFGQIGRMFAPVERYKTFARMLDKRCGAGPPPADLCLQLQDADNQPIVYSPVSGSRVGVLLPRLTLESFPELFVRTANVIPPPIIDDNLLEPSASLRLNLGFAEDAVEDDLEDRVQAMLPHGMSVDWPSGWLDRPLSAFPEPPQWLICVLKIIAAVIQQRPGLALSRTVLESLPKGTRRRLGHLKEFGPTYVLATRLKDLPVDIEDEVLIASSEGLQWQVPRADAAEIAAASRHKTTAPTPDASLDDMASMA